MSWLRTGPTRELCGKEPSQKKELFRNGGNFTLDRCLSMGDPTDPHNTLVSSEKMKGKGKWLD